jgi:hypothetical protein
VRFGSVHALRDELTALTLLSQLAVDNPVFGARQPENASRINGTWHCGLLGARRHRPNCHAKPRNEFAPSCMTRKEHTEG